MDLALRPRLGIHPRPRIPRNYRETGWSRPRSVSFHASNAADASANSARVAAFRNGIHIEEWRRGNCVVQQQSGTGFGTLYAALILHRIGNNHPTAGVKRDPVITVTVNLNRNLDE